MMITVMLIAVAIMAAGLARCGVGIPIKVLIRPEIAPAILDFEYKNRYYHFHENERGRL